MYLFKKAIPSLIIAILLFIMPTQAASPVSTAQREAYTQYIKAHFPRLLKDRCGKKRRSMSQFGYGLSYFPFPFYPITQFVNPKNYGKHSYGPGVSERNGSLYTCRGGFMDFSHIRTAADWTVYLTLRILREYKSFDLPDEGGKLELVFRDPERLTIEDIATIAQKIAYERLEWHELASWHYHLPNYTFNEQQSTFTPEDTYSNFLGTVIGKKIALRILTEQPEHGSYQQIATEEIQKAVAVLVPMDTREKSKRAYDIVDRNVQLKLPEQERNTDIWWDSKILFRDGRYVFKRNTDIGPAISPWLVPQSDRLGCSDTLIPQVWEVPQLTTKGDSLYRYYDFKITPERNLFYNKYTHKQKHVPFAPFMTRDMQAVVDQVIVDMTGDLKPGFNKRDHKDPVPKFKGVRLVVYK